MKKYLVALMVLVFALALVACNGGDVADTTEPVTDPVSEHVHAFAEEIIPATCTATGKVISKCECGEIENETEIPVSDHVASVLDCEKDTVCTVCNTVLAEKTGHILAASEVVTAPTCSTAGKEKGACVTCGAVVETEIPSTGHIAGASIKLVDGGFSTDCKTCGQAIVLKADKTVYALGFDEDILTEAAKYDVGLAIANANDWKVENGTLSFLGGKVGYINIVDPTKLADLGTFMISFDFTSTKEAPSDKKASVFSILSNFYDGKTNVGGTTGWGWIFKLNEEKDVMSTVIESAKVNDDNSLAVERNVKYNVQAVVDPTSKVVHVFINGKYIGNSGQVPALSNVKPETATLRFGDGPDCGYVFDNFAIVDLK